MRRSSTRARSLRRALRRARAVSCGAALLASAAACTTTSQAFRADYRPAMRYGYDPERVTVATREARPVLLDERGAVVERPWVAAGTYTTSPFAIAPDGARLAGCDAYAVAPDRAARRGGGVSLTPWSAPGLRGLPLRRDEAVCIQYVDAPAQERRRRDEGAWVWTAYQRPTLGGGWSIAAWTALWPFGSGQLSSTLPWYGVSVEKYFRALPLGFAVRLAGSAGERENLALPGVSVLVPVISLWRVQLTAAGSFDYALRFVDNGGGSTTLTHGPRVGVGGYVDAVLGRVCCAVGAGFEYWFADAQLRGGPVMIARLGLPF